MVILDWFKSESTQGLSTYPIFLICGNLQEQRYPKAGMCSPSASISAGQCRVQTHDVVKTPDFYFILQEDWVFLPGVSTQGEWAQKLNLEIRIIQSRTFWLTCGWEGLRFKFTETVLDPKWIWFYESLSWMYIYIWSWIVIFLKFRVHFNLSLSLSLSHWSAIGYWQTCY